MAHSIPKLGRKKLKSDGFLYCSDIMALTGKSRRQSVRILQELHNAKKFDGVHFRIKNSPLLQIYFSNYRKRVRKLKRSQEVSGFPSVELLRAEFFFWERYVMKRDPPDNWTIEQIEKFFVELQPILDFANKLKERGAALTKNTAGQSPG